MHLSRAKLHRDSASRFIRSLSACLLLALVTTSGCEDPFALESGTVHVTNRTDLTIEVEYKEYVNEDYSRWRKTEIEPGGSAWLDVESSFWDADIVVTYCVYSKEYDLDLGILGSDHIEVELTDFPPCAAP